MGDLFHIHASVFEQLGGHYGVFSKTCCRQQQNQVYIYPEGYTFTHIFSTSPELLAYLRTYSDARWFPLSQTHNNVAKTTIVFDDDHEEQIDEEIDITSNPTKESEILLPPPPSKENTREYLMLWCQCCKDNNDKLLLYTDIMETFVTV